MNVRFITLGCKVNQYETQTIREQLLSNGYIENNNLPPELVIINSCTVTAESDRKTRQAINKSKRLNPEAAVLLTGCFPQAFGEKAAEETSADIIIGNASNNLIPALTEQYLFDRKKIVHIIPHKKDNSLSTLKNGHYEGHTRAFVKIEDGCNRFCSYCIIPYARGRVRSKTLTQITGEITALAENGCKEVVLAGINLTAFGSDTNCDISDAVFAAASIPGIERIRLGSMEPDQLTVQIIEKLSSCGKLCGQFHISLQSGCDATLYRMKRNYDTDMYRSLVEKLREKFEGCSVTTDVMVGFPGETDDDFSQSCSFVKETGFSRVHVFAYSKREGTPAAAMEEQIPKKIKEQRSRTMIEITNGTAQEFMYSVIEKKQEVLFEQEVEKGVFEGYSKNYIAMRAVSPSNICGKIKTVIPTEVCEKYCICKLYNTDNT